jgi:hypothetical protein
MLRVLTAALAIASGVIVLLGYFLRQTFPILEQLRLLLTDWAIVIAGAAVLVGILNLVSVQMEKLRSRQPGGLYGALLVFALVITFGLGLVLGTDHIFLRTAMEAVIVPVEASLLAILAITLVYASIRLLRRRTDLMSVIFLAAFLIFLVASMPKPFGPIPFVDQLILDVMGTLSTSGARGLLIGVALGTLLTALRVLFGIDRPYGGN